MCEIILYKSLNVYVSGQLFVTTIITNMMGSSKPGLDVEESSLWFIIAFIITFKQPSVLSHICANLFLLTAALQYADDMRNLPLRQISLISSHNYNQGKQKVLEHFALKWLIVTPFSPVQCCATETDTTTACQSVPILIHF